MYTHMQASSGGEKKYCIQDNSLREQTYSPDGETRTVKNGCSRRLTGQVSP